MLVPTIVIPQVTTPDNLHTDLTKSPWTEATRINTLMAMGTYMPAKQPTMVYLCYDANALWLAYKCDNLTGAKLKTDIAEQDGPVWRNDCVEFYCDQHETGFQFYQVDVSATGVVYDAKYGDTKWSAKAQTLVAKDGQNYVAAMRIPFASLEKTPQTGQVWPFNIARQSPHGGCSLIWTRNGPQEVEDFGRLVFGGTSTTVVRLSSTKPMAIGKNSIAVDNATGISCRVVSRDKNRTVVSNASAQRIADSFFFTIQDDRIRSVDITLSDKDGKTLAAWSSQVTSPELSGRLAEWSRRVKIMGKVADRWPASIAKEAKKLTADAEIKIREANGIAEDTSTISKARWQRIAAILADLDARLSNLSCLAQTLDHFPKAGFAVGLESPMRKVLIRDHLFEGWFAKQATVSLARNEHEAIQVVTIPIGRKLKNVRVRAEMDQAAKSPAPKCSVSLVGHVDGDDNPPYDITYTGYWPDPLLDYTNKADVNAGEHVSFWIDVATAKGTPAGNYQATISVEADDCETVKIPLTVRVWGFELIDGTHLPTAFTYNEQPVKAFYKEQWNKTLARKYHDLLLDHRIGVDNLYRREAPAMDLIKYAISRGANAFNLGFVASTGGRDRLMRNLTECVPLVRKAGLLEKAYLYAFDEIKSDKYVQARAIFDEIHSKFPGLRTMTTAGDNSLGKRSGLREAVDIWVPTTRNYNLAAADEIRKEGKKVWWYICLSPIHPYANWFIEYPTIESRLLMGPMTYKYRADGFLYYMVDNWRDNKTPITGGPYLTWNPASCPNRHQKWANGDGNLIYPGVDGPLSCIRLENIRDGLEDYEYLYILAEKVKKVAALSPTSARQDFLKTARELLAIPDTLVRSTVEFTTDPAAVSAWRTQLAEAILAADNLETAAK